MVKQLKKIIFRSMSLKNYLRILQRSYFFLYNTRILKLSNNYTYHYYAKKVIKKGDIVVDIGANLGYYSILFAKWVGNAGKVYSVEPIKIYNEIFNEKAKKCNNITLYPYALGLEEKKIKMVSSPHTGYLNTGLPHVYDEKNDGKIENVEFCFEAEMKIPEKLFAPLKKIDYIKCDIEGFEYVVLSNMKNIINERRPVVQVEVWKDNESAIKKLFNDMNYLPYKIQSNKLVLLSNTESEKIEGDYIFIPQEKNSIYQN